LISKGNRHGNYQYSKKDSIKKFASLLLILLAGCTPHGPITAGAGFLTPPDQFSTVAPEAHPTFTDPSDTTQSIGFVNGISFPSEGSLAIGEPFISQSLLELKATGANWVAIYTIVKQETIGSTDIIETTPEINDANLVFTIQEAHRLGLKVMVKPHIDLANDPAHWRGQIGLFFSSSQWQAWFDSYTRMITHFAILAEKNHAEMFCVGTELTQAQTHESAFRQVTAEVREVFSGPLTYAGNWNAYGAIKWWDALDVIGVDAYFPLTVWTNPDLEDLKNGWQPFVEYLSLFSQRWNRQVIFTEVGYTSQKRSAEAPMSWEAGQLDLQIQANLYQALFDQVYHQPWFSGLFIWTWECDPYQGGATDSGYTPKGKPAEIILQQAFNVSR
jgi:hypothetical protein